MCDPVLGDEGKLFVSDAIADAVLNGLWPHADWLTPNSFELGLLTGRAIGDLNTAREAAKRIGKPVLVSSIRTALVVPGADTPRSAQPWQPKAATAASGAYRSAPTNTVRQSSAASEAAAALPLSASRPTRASPLAPFALRSRATA